MYFILIFHSISQIRNSIDKKCKVQYAEVMMVIKLQKFICILDVVNTASIQSSILRKRLSKKKVLTPKPVDVKF